MPSRAAELKFDPRLYLVLDPSLSAERDITMTLKEAIDGGVTLVQVREKGCSDSEFLALIQQVMSVTRPRRTPLIVNDRLDVAMAVQAEGLHIGQADVHWSHAREVLGPRAILGLSVETAAQAHDAESAHVDYLGVSSIFPTASKADARTIWGLTGLRELRRRSQRCLVAIGGINPANAREVLACGADGLAVVSAICAAPRPGAEARKLRGAIEAHQEGGAHAMCTSPDHRRQR